MLSIRFPLALIITLILSVTSYFVHQSFSSTGFAPFIAPLFVALTLGLMLIPSLLASAPLTEDKIKTKKFKTAAPSSDSSLATLYVGNLPYKASEESIKQLFADIGRVESVRLMKDRKTGRRKGFGFVEVEAGRLNEFITKLNDFEFMDRTIKVRPAKDKAE